MLQRFAEMDQEPSRCPYVRSAMLGAAILDGERLYGFTVYAITNAASGFKRPTTYFGRTSRPVKLRLEEHLGAYDKQGRARFDIPLYDRIKAGWVTPQVVPLIAEDWGWCQPKYYGQRWQYADGWAYTNQWLAQMSYSDQRDMGLFQGDGGLDVRVVYSGLRAESAASLEKEEIWCWPYVTNIRPSV